MLKRLLRFLLLIILLPVLAYAGYVWFLGTGNSHASVCRGSVVAGRLESGSRRKLGPARAGRRPERLDVGIASSLGRMHMLS